jgi:amino acid transporter
MTDERTLADVHRDIDFGNRYRLEYIKHLMSLSAGVFVVSIAFMKELMPPERHVRMAYGLGVGWVSLILSLFSGIAHMRYWASFYISFLKPFDDPVAKARRRRINARRKIAELLQLGCFVTGLVLILLFAILNLP